MIFHGKTNENGCIENNKHASVLHIQLQGIAKYDTYQMLCIFIMQCNEQNNKKKETKKNKQQQWNATWLVNKNTQKIDLKNKVKKKKKQQNALHK